MTQRFLTIEQLKAHYESLRAEEDMRRLELNQKRRGVNRMARLSLAAYDAWQKALKEREEAKAK